MWVSQTPMNWNCYFLIKLSQQSSRRRVCIEYVLCRAVKVSPLPSNIIHPPLSWVVGGLPRPQLYTYSAYTKHKGGWLACKIIVIQTLSLLSFLFFALPPWNLMNSISSLVLFTHTIVSQLVIKLPYFISVLLM